MAGLGVQRVIGAGVAVSVGSEEEYGLVPPVEHQHHQHVPQLMAGTQVVQLACGCTHTHTHNYKQIPLLNTHVTNICRTGRLLLKEQWIPWWVSDPKL